VSHGHRVEVCNLLGQLIKWYIPELKRVVITLNAPLLDGHFFRENLSSLPFELLIIENKYPLGFGANHNKAFMRCDSKYFFVLNPDLDLIVSPFCKILDCVEGDNIGCAYPVQISKSGLRLDFERALVSPTRIIERHLFPQCHQKQTNLAIDWINGAFMAFKSSVFRDLNGFDERYFMYCEDVDICLRLRLAGYQLAKADATVIHHTQRRTLKNLQHLAWHVRSLLRLWNSAPYKQYKQRFIDNKA
jgi:N-acetylglucosaminyl-diphospho-decaprenol L-rhamnosyltransferase